MTEDDVVDADGNPRQAFTYNPHLSSVTLSVRVENPDGTVTKKMIPARDVESINSVASADQYKAERTQAMQDSVKAMYEPPTLSEIWGTEVQPGAVLNYNGGTWIIDGHNVTRGEWTLTQVNPDGTPMDGAQAMTVDDTSFRTMGLLEKLNAMQQQGASEEEMDDVVSDLNAEESLKNIDASDNEDNIWDNIAGFMQGYFEANEEGDPIPDESRPEAGYIVALQKGDIGKALGIVDERIAELQTRLAEKPQQVENNGEGVVGLAANQSLADSAAEETQKQIDFLTGVRDGLVAKQQEQAQTEQRQAANTPVSQMEVGTEFPVAIEDGAVARVEGKDADGRSVVSVYDANGDIMEAGIDDWSDEQWDAVRVRPQAEDATDRTDGTDSVLTEQPEPQPVGTGSFGDIYDQFRGKPKEAAAFLMKKRSGEATGALSHRSVGEIDLVWGEEGTGKSDGFGLAKLVKYHPEVVEHLQELLDEMEVVSRSANRVNLESKTHKAGVRLDWDGVRKTWLMTMFEKKGASEPTNGTTDITGNQSGLENDTAPFQSPDVSDGKDNTNSDTATQNGENISQQSVELPRDKDGEVDYDQISDQNVYAQALTDEFGEDALAILDETIQETKDEMDNKKAIERARIGKRLAMLEAAREILKPKEAVATADEVPVEQPTPLSEGGQAPVEETTVEQPTAETAQEEAPIEEAPAETPMESAVEGTEQEQTEQPAETEGQPKKEKQEKKDSETTKRLTAVGEPRTVEEAILMDIATGGATFRWGNRDEDKRVTKRGIGDLWRYDNKEQRKRIGILKKDGYSIETYAEAILAGQLAQYSGAVSQIAEKMDFQDVVAAIEDVLQMTTSKSGALKAIEEKRQAEAEAEQRYIRSVQDAEAQAQGFEDWDDYCAYQESFSDVAVSDEEYYEISSKFAEQYQEEYERQQRAREIESETDTGVAESDEQQGVHGEGEGGDSLLQAEQTPDTGTNQQPGQTENSPTGNPSDGSSPRAATEGEPAGAAEVRAEIDRLKAQRANLIQQRDDIQRRYEQANGLFGDTQADEGDLFGGQNFLSPELAQATIDGYSRQIKQIDEQIARLEASLRNAQNVKQTELGEGGEDIPQHVAEALGELGVGEGQIHVVTDKSQLPKEEGTAYSYIKRGFLVEGWYNPDTGEVYLYAPNLKSKERVKKVVMHELVSHKGLRGLLGREGFDGLCDEVWKAMAGADRQRMIAYVRYQDEEAKIPLAEYARAVADAGTRRAAADEYMAHLSEKGIEASVWERIRNAVVNALRKLGFDIGLSDADIRSLLRESYGALIVDHVRFSIAPAAQEHRLLNEEEKLAAKEKLENTSPIKTTSGIIKADENTTARQAAEKWANEHLKTPLKFDTEAGQVTIDKTSVKNSLAHGYNQAKLDAIPTLEEGFGNATYLGGLEEIEGSDRNETVNHYFAYSITFGDDLNYVFCRAKADSNKNRLYVHEVFVADKIKSNTLQTAAGNNSEPHRGIAFYRSILSDVLNAKVQQNSEPASENGENVLFSIRKPFGGNSGYVGYSKSKRAVGAEERGLRNKSQMDSAFADEVNALIQERNPNAPKVTLKQIKDSLDGIRADEWHHTSMYGNRTNYYSAQTIADHFIPETEEEKNSREQRETREKEYNALRNEIANEVYDSIPHEEINGKDYFRTSEGHLVEHTKNTLELSKRIRLIPDGANALVDDIDEWTHEHQDEYNKAIAEYNAAKQEAFDNVPQEKKDRVVELRNEIKDKPRFSPTQIKSATDNNGEFDAGNPDIRFSISEGSEEEETPEQSVSEEELEGYDAGKMTMRDFLLNTLAQNAKKNKENVQNRLDAVMALSQSLHKLLLDMRNMRRRKTLSKKTEAQLERSVEGISKAQHVVNCFQKSCIFAL